MKVLVVDDNAVSRKIMKATCESLGYKVVEAKDGEEAWEKFNTYPIRIVISDWVMPKCTGLELCQKIRKSPNADYTYFFLVTGLKTTFEDFDHARNEGIDDFIYKPLDFHVFRNQFEVAERMLSMISDNVDNRAAHKLKTGNLRVQLPKQSSGRVY